MLHIQHTYISRGSGGINFNCSGVNPADFLKHFLHKCSIMGEGRKFKLGGGGGGEGGEGGDPSVPPLYKTPMYIRMIFKTICSRSFTHRASKAGQPELKYLILWYMQCPLMHGCNKCHVRVHAWSHLPHDAPVVVSTCATYTVYVCVPHD